MGLAGMAGTSEGGVRLANSAILREIEDGNLVFAPELGEGKVGPSSVDLTLSDTFHVIGSRFREQREAGIASVIELVQYDWPEFVRILGEPEIVRPGEFFKIPVGELVIGYTRESVSLPRHLGGRIDGKSSIARIGLFVHISAPTIHPGWNGRIALEFYNVGPLPIRVRTGDTICQLILERVEGEGLYRGQFQA